MDSAEKIQKSVPITGSMGQSNQKGMGLHEIDVTSNDDKELLINKMYVLFDNLMLFVFRVFIFFCNQNIIFYFWFMIGY